MSKPPTESPLPPADQAADRSQTIGTRLKDARQRQGISIDEVAERTRIRATIVREIEADDFSGCGGTFYARGHVRAIATTVGLDPAPLLAAFDRGQEALPHPAITLPPYVPSSGRGRDAGTPGTGRSRLGLNWPAAMVAAAALIALIVVGSFVVSLSGKGTQTVTTASNAATPSPSAAASDDQGSASSDGAATSTDETADGADGTDATGSGADATAGTPAGVDLRLRVVTGASWIRVTDASGSEVYQGVLRSGEMKDFRDDTQLTVRYGNSRAVTVVLNGNALGRPDCHRAVCTQQYEPTAAAG